MNKVTEKTPLDEKVSEPLEIRMTGDKGETEFYLFVRGEDEKIKEIIDFLIDYLEFSKIHKRIKSTKSKKND